MGWERYSHEQFGLNRFGASGPYKEVYAVSSFPTLFVWQCFILTFRRNSSSPPRASAKRALATIDFYKGHNVRSPINRAFQQIL